LWHDDRLLEDQFGIESHVINIFFDIFVIGNNYIDNDNILVIPSSVTTKKYSSFIQEVGNDVFDINMNSPLN